jgi:hypothetical protein
MSLGILVDPFDRRLEAAEGVEMQSHAAMLGADAGMQRILQLSGPVLPMRSASEIPYSAWFGLMVAAARRCG